MSFGMVAASYFAVAGNGGGDSGYADSVMQDNPLIYLKFDETNGTVAADASGNGRNGAYNNSPTLGQYSILPGGVGHSFNAENGTGGGPPSQHVSVSYGSWMNASELTVTFCCFATVGTYRLWATRYGEPGNNWSWFVYVNNNTFQFQYRSSGGTNTNVDSGVTVVSGQRYYVAAYVGSSGCGIRVYDETGLIGSATGAGGSVNTSTRNITLMDAETFNYKTSGYMDELAVFGTALSTARLDTLADTALNPAKPWIARSAGIAARNGTTEHTISFTPAQVGSLLVAVVAAPLTWDNTALTSGWTQRLNVSFNEALTVFTRSANAGDMTLHISHGIENNVPMAYVVYEFPAGSSWQGSSTSGTPNTFPTLSGLSGSPTVFAAVADRLPIGSSPSGGFDWRYFWSDDYDQKELPGVTDGVSMNVGYFADFPDATADADQQYLDSSGFNVSTLFAINIP